MKIYIKKSTEERRWGKEGKDGVVVGEERCRGV